MTQSDATTWIVGGLVAPVVSGYLLHRAATGGERTDPAIDELQSAYARGDLSEEGYERRRERLEDSSSGSDE
ncbi:SHOCT domain-containing protein [Halobellus captivus]|uniref:hypothetical protein n=1 Tax=Halobellus captivus TaxID=2592614 RepID=UPI0011A06E10|nr:hypothetical protein [Halobellus captivus]